MNETIRKMIEDKLELKRTSLAYHQEEASDYRRLVRKENAQIKVLKQEIADMEEALDDATD